MHATDNLVLAADNLLQGIAAHNGATVDVFTGRAIDLAAGYVVSIDGYDWTAHNYSNAAAWSLEPYVQQYVNHAPTWIDDLHAGNPVYVGAWVDTDTNVLHLDLSAVFTDRTLALQCAAEQRQLAIWDYSTGSEIRVDTTDYSGDDDERHPDSVVSLHKPYRHHSDVRNPLSTFNRGGVTLRKAGE